MKLSAPIYQLKKRAKRMVRNDGVPLHQALDTIAREEGFTRWSLLSAHTTAGPLSQTLLSQLKQGDMLLLAGRRGQGKTALGLQLLLDAARLDRKAVFFTLEFTETEARAHLHARSGGTDESSDKVEIVTSPEISADYIVRHLSGAPAGSVAVIDYLQILDQRRSTPPLSEQVGSLSALRSGPERSSVSSRRSTAHSILKASRYPISATCACRTLWISDFSTKPAFCMTVQRSCRILFDDGLRRSLSLPLVRRVGEGHFSRRLRRFGSPSGCRHLPHKGGDGGGRACLPSDRQKDETLTPPPHSPAHNSTPAQPAFHLAHAHCPSSPHSPPPDPAPPSQRRNSSFRGGSDRGRRRRSRPHGVAFGERHAGCLLGVEQAEECDLFGVVGLGGVAGRGADALVGFADQLLGRVGFVGRISPEFITDLFVHAFGEGFGEAGRRVP